MVMVSLALQVPVVVTAKSILSTSKASNGLITTEVWVLHPLASTAVMVIVPPAILPTVKLSPVPETVPYKYSIAYGPIPPCIAPLGTLICACSTPPEKPQLNSCLVFSISVLLIVRAVGSFTVAV